jgi:hypothetical protein
MPLEAIIETNFGTLSKEFTVVVLEEDAQIRIQEFAPVENNRINSISNDILEIQSSEDFVGSITSIKYSDTEFVRSNFPTLAPSMFFPKDPGGLSTLLLGENEDLDDLSFFKEKFEKSITHTDPWHGLEYTVRLNEKKSLKGLLLRIGYELLGGRSNILKIRVKFENPTSTSFKLLSIHFLAPGVDNSTEGLITHFDIANALYKQTFTRENPQPVFGMGTQNFQVLKYEKEGNTVAIITPHPNTSIFPLEAGKMIITAGVAGYWRLEPSESKEVSFYLIFNSPSDAFTAKVEQHFKQ